MSYSIFARAATKPELKDALAAKMAEVVAQQEVHATDQKQTLEVANAFIDLLKLEPNDEQEYRVNMNGYLSWTDASDPLSSISSANVSVAAFITSKIAKE